MSRARIAIFFLVAFASSACGAESALDRLDEALTVSGFNDAARARVSGTLDLEGYSFQSPAPGLIYTPGNSLFNPRLTLFLDAQFGSQIYFFAQARADRGFDPSDEDAELRLDEYALRVTPWLDGRFSFQLGKFATLVGSWAPRHGSWENPFVTAPLPYENLTGIWDSVAARSVGTVLFWSHVRPVPFRGSEYADKHLRLPVIWGPAYATGAAIFGRVGKFTYAAEIKNAALSSRPASWNDSGELARQPTCSGRLGYAPNEMWNLGFSASAGTYLRPLATPTVPAGLGRGDYRQTVLGQDISFAWHHVQVWAEFFETRFAVPRVGALGTFAYYTEIKYKFTPQFFGALRWNQQQFSTVTDSAGARVPWGRETWRIDVAPGYRFSVHTQLKLQYSLQHEDGAARNIAHAVTAQFTVRF